VQPFLRLFFAGIPADADRFDLRQEREMLGGRYLWWLMMCIAGFFAMSIYFEYLVWVLFRLFGCREISASCGEAAVLMTGTAQIFVLCLVPVIVLGATYLRVSYLQFSLAWVAAVFLWIVDILPFAANVDDLWRIRIELSSLSLLPPSGLFLMGFCAVLCLPLEGHEPASAGMAAKVQWVGGWAAFCLALAMIVTDPLIATVVSRNASWPLIGSLAALHHQVLALPFMQWVAGIVSSYKVFPLFITATSLGVGILMAFSIKSPPAKSRRAHVLDRPTARHRV
jgi:hypothetical protein